MQFNQATDYAFRVILHLASVAPGTVVSAQAMAEAERITPQYLRKIMRALGRADLVRSRRGAIGGFELTRPAAAISLLDVVEAMEGPFSLHRCLDHPELCNKEAAGHCPVHRKLAGIGAEIRRALGGADFAGLLADQKQGGV